MAQEKPTPPPDEPVPLEIEPDAVMPAPPAPPPPPKAKAPDDEPISLADVAEAESGVSKIKIGRTLGDAAKKAVKTEYKRKLNLTGQGATRCRIFHSKIALAPLENMEKHINEWLDREEIEIKHVTDVVGVLEGKVAEPNLIVMVWY